MSKKKAARSNRQHTDPFIKAAAHPTRQTILKGLKENDSLSTLELEVLTNENRYNLYHHLSKLVEADLVEAKLDNGRAKRYSLKADIGGQDRFLHLDKDDPAAAKVIAQLLRLLEGSGEASPPDAKDVESVSVIFRSRD